MTLHYEHRPSLTWRRRAALPLAVGLALMLGLSACGEDDDGEAATPTTTEAGSDETTTTTSEEAAVGETVEITGVDYDFEGVPDSVPVGTSLSFTNGSEGEVHEMVVFRVDDDESRPLEEIFSLPEEEAEEVTEFKGVALALPGQPGFVPEGDLTLDEPGTYALLCFINVGADPAAYEAVFANPPAEGEDPPEIPGTGGPHFTQGMVAELTVE